ncbi:fibronectin type III domain-containing protein [Parapedobacter sp. 2B3]|uniref:fibronectin type III domain-containing protein n=1 Tax=Parapedobacter sp. 2B3 TaxID=3342381 RepID=UPI0035B591C1
MKKRTARGGFKNIKDNDLLNLGGTVLLAMESNANFTTPDPDLAVVQAAYDDYKLKLETASRQGSPLDKSVKRDSKTALVGLLKRLAFYVNTVADGDLSIVLSSGFPVAGLPTPLMPPGIPERLRLLDYLQSGQLNLEFDPVEGAWLFEICVSSEKDAAGNIIWPEPFISRSRTGNILAPLEVGVRYYARVRARNGSGVSDWSEPVSQLVR